MAYSPTCPLSKKDWVVKGRGRCGSGADETEANEHVRQAISSRMVASLLVRSQANEWAMPNPGAFLALF
eukprot:666384-Pleurochrysis_carterae.AAC.1